jgi:salicylate hydroxylase
MNVKKLLEFFCKQGGIHFLLSHHNSHKQIKTMSYLSTLSVGIVGGGIGGLTAAFALAKRGASIRVYEQASHFLPTAGAAFGLSPNGQVCIESLGIRTRDNIHRFDSMNFIDKLGRISKESNFFEQVFQRHGFTIGGCIRGDLVDILAKSLDKDTLQYCHKVVDIQQDESKVRLWFENGNTEPWGFRL